MGRTLRRRRADAEVPLLVDYLRLAHELAPSFPVMIDCKTPAAGWRAYRDASALGLIEHRLHPWDADGRADLGAVCFAGLSWTWARIQAANPQVVCLATWADAVFAERVLRSVPILRPSGYNPHYRWVDPRQAEAWHNQNMIVSSWVINDPYYLAQCFAYGVDVVITDYPEMATIIRSSPELQNALLAQRPLDASRMLALLYPPAEKVVVMAAGLGVNAALSTLQRILLDRAKEEATNRLVNCAIGAITGASKQQPTPTCHYK